MRLLYTVFALVVVCSAASADSYETPAPVPQDASAPLVEETSASAVLADPYATPVPVDEDASATLVEETRDPVNEETSYSAASADSYETPAPVPQADDAAEETPAPPAQVPYAATETPAPLAQDAPSEEETLAPVAEETPAADPSNYRARRRRRQVDNITADITTTTSTTRPLNTTSAGLGINANEESGNATATCSANAVCFHDEDCGSVGEKKGRCLGFFNGKCNCNACLNFLSCTDDSACGGLKGACNATTSRCSCDEGYRANGFAAGMLDAFRELCNVKDCNGENHADACFGLPCNSGRCIC